MNIDLENEVFAIAKHANEFYDKNELPRPNFRSSDGLKAIHLAIELFKDKAKTGAVLDYLHAIDTIPVQPMIYEYSNVIGYVEANERFQKDTLIHNEVLKDTENRVVSMGLKAKLPKMESTDFELLVSSMPHILKEYDLTKEQKITSKPWESKKELPGVNRINDYRDSLVKITNLNDVPDFIDNIRLTDKEKEELVKKGSIERGNTEYHLENGYLTRVTFGITSQQVDGVAKSEVEFRNQKPWENSSDVEPSRNRLKY